LIDDGAKFDVMVEDRIIASTNDFLRAFAITVACHYVFNLEYNEKLTGTLFIFLSKNLFLK